MGLKELVLGILDIATIIITLSLCKASKDPLIINIDDRNKDNGKEA